MGLVIEAFVFAILGIESLDDAFFYASLDYIFLGFLAEFLGFYESRLESNALLLLLI